MTVDSAADVRAVARTYFEDASPAHDWRHVRRVERLATRLAADRDDVDERVLELAVYLHDIGRSREADGRIEDHAAWGAREARDVLAAFPDETVEAVCHCIRSHRYSTDVEPETVEARLLSDADNLDAIGAVGIARAFTHGGEFGQPIHPDRSDSESDAAGTSLEHIESKLLSLRERMYTDAGRRVANERHAFVESYLDRLERELAGADSID
ncbi:HD domain-containing protein [Halovivax limisalsi]|uniref:HD domain-containing protein n=1 Tax=Halovivax limisalsi TaxID=1453760 RepID=UPI001FFDCECC|nr:HD domain-containing protein [Halovivax limisalsi]